MTTLKNAVVVLSLLASAVVLAWLVAAWLLAPMPGGVL